jgi:DNA-binding NarL/FixJ family response regulator
MDVLVVDNHPLVHLVMPSIIKSAVADAVVHAATDFEGALRLARSLNDIQLVLLDLGLGESSGVQTLIEFRKRFPTLRTVVFTAEEDAATIESSLNAGASGYILKTSPADVIASAIRRVLAGDVYTPPLVLTSGSKLSTKSGAVLGTGANPNRSMPLTERQIDVLTLLAKGYRNRQIALKLNVTEGTVKQHVHAIYQSLGISSRTEAMIAAGRLGICVGDADDKNKNQPVSGTPVGVMRNRTRGCS